MKEIVPDRMRAVTVGSTRCAEMRVTASRMPRLRMLPMIPRTKLRLYAAGVSDRVGSSFSSVYPLVSDTHMFCAAMAACRGCSLSGTTQGFSAVR